MYHTPQNFLNGTLPFNVTGSVSPCIYEVNGGPVGGACPPSQVSLQWSESTGVYAREYFIVDAEPDEGHNKRCAR